MYTHNSYELFLSLLLIIEVINHPDVCSCPNAYHNRGGANATKRIKQKPNATTNKPMVNITNKVQHIILIHCQRHQQDIVQSCWATCRSGYKDHRRRQIIFLLSLFDVFFANLCFLVLFISAKVVAVWQEGVRKKGGRQEENTRCTEGGWEWRMLVNLDDVCTQF
jgi:hypothetical protein